LRQAVFAKDCFKNRLHARRVGLPRRLAPQQIPAARIRDRQRIDALVVCGARGINL
jgi:hypothetical protein